MTMHLKPITVGSIESACKKALNMFNQQIFFTVYATMMSELIINSGTNELSVNDELSNCIF